MRSLLILDRETGAYKVHANKLRTITCYKNITQQIVVRSEGNVFCPSTPIILGLFEPLK
jgi:hypothetical protein